MSRLPFRVDNSLSYRTTARVMNGSTTCSSCASVAACRTPLLHESVSQVGLVVAGLQLMAVTVTSQALWPLATIFSQNLKKKDRRLSGLTISTLAPTPYDAVYTLQ